VRHRSSIRRATLATGPKRPCSILVENGGYDMRSAPTRAQSGAAVPMTEEEEVDATLAQENVKVTRRGRDTGPH
jgi:hypothetical protein